MEDIFLYFFDVGSLVFISWIAVHLPDKLRILIAYSLFFTTPVLTYFGLLAPLTGFNRSNTAYFGLSFLTPFLALLVAMKPAQILIKPLRFFAVAANPLYLTCGPIPKSTSLKLSLKFKNFWRRFRIIQNDTIIGICFITVIAPSFSLLQLKHSTQPIDILLFGLFFEYYVYFNFAGYSMLAWSSMKLVGIDVVRNFATPFSSTSVVEYWKKWHISLSLILSELFFKPSKLYLGVYGAALVTFCSSALWHGITLNFLLWGGLHGTCWSLSRWLYLKRAHIILQFFLLYFSIIIGRILFSESDFQILALKFYSLFDTNEWSNYQFFYIFKTATLKTQIGILIGMSLIIVEIAFLKYPNHIKNYRHLKKPIISTALLACCVLLGVYGDEGAIYGRR